MNHHPWDVDVAVVGGGPAGSAAAASLARSGRRVLVLERDAFPRFHVGESLLPMSNGLFRELGLEGLPVTEGYREKRGASFLSDCGEKGYRIDFSDSDEVAEPVACHVTRAEFDQRLLRHAADSGATVVEGARAAEARFDEEGVRLFYDEGGERREVRAGFLLDASGRFGFLARRMGLRVPDRDLRMVALFAHYEGVGASAAVPAGDIRVVTREDLGWWWVIPLSETRTSVGLVFSAGRDPRRRGEDPADTLRREAEGSPVMREILGRATLVGEPRCEADFSYGTRAYGGDRFLLLGDAGSFLDPVFSTGVELALAGGLEAARATDAALARGTSLRGSLLGRYERTQRRRYRFYRRFVKSFYVPLFREMLFQAADWPRVTRAIVTALAGVDRPRLTTRLILSWVFLTVKLRGRESGPPAAPTGAGAGGLRTPFPEATP